MTKKSYSYGAGKPSGNNRGVLEDAAPSKSKQIFNDPNCKRCRDAKGDFKPLVNMHFCDCPCHKMVRE